MAAIKTLTGCVVAAMVSLTALIAADSMLPRDRFIRDAMAMRFVFRRVNGSWFITAFAAGD
jgi:hypothetical protein